MTEHPQNSVPLEQPPDVAVAVAPPHPLVNASDGASQNGHDGSTNRIEALEAELADWQRRAVVWRERAVSTQALNDALTNNLEDLRLMLQVRAAADDIGRHEGTVERAPSTQALTDQWWTKVFRRETWMTRR
jgi:hypothetical protein